MDVEQILNKSVTKRIDINCDLGEGMSNDAQLMPFISSCSIACGGHYGTKETIQKTILLAKEHNVKIGAHPSYPDKTNFGRKQIHINSTELIDSISAQLTDFLSVCKNEGVYPNHFKLHGALYNVAANDEQTANTILQVLRNLDLAIPLFAPSQSVLATILRGNNPVIPEGFIDRMYQKDGNLLSRNEPNSLIESPSLAWDQLKQFYFDQQIMTSDGTMIPMIAETYCLHGDAKNALNIAKYISVKLKEQHITLAKNA